MPLWGSNTANASDKPSYLNANGTYYDKADCEGITVADANAQPGILTAGWTQMWGKLGGVKSVAVANGGSGYANGETLVFADATSANAAGAAATLTTNATGGVVSITVTAAGTGYDANTTATANTVAGTGATFSVTTTARTLYEPLVAARSFS